MSHHNEMIEAKWNALKLQVRAAKVRGGGHENLELFPGCNIYETFSSYWPATYLALQQSQRVIKLFYQK